MIISNIIGGLGNQMFQFAAGLALSQERDAKQILATDMFETYSLHQGYELDRVFGINTKQASKEIISNILGWRANKNLRRLMAKVNSPKFLLGNNFIVETVNMDSEKFFNTSNNVYLHGYWQSDRFFGRHSRIIRSAFNFAEVLDEENKELLNQIKQSRSVSIHMRRGDYLKGRNKFIYHQCDPEYFIRGVEILKKKFDSLKFYVFSDDPSGAAGIFSSDKSDFTIVTHNSGRSSYRDMQLISACNHHIISNSSFSWWGAWLNPNEEKIVISPEQWMKGVPASHVVPADWIKI